MNKKKLFFIMFFVVVLTATVAGLVQAQADIGNGDNFGVGIMVGEPSGITVKNWFNENSAFDIGAAWTLPGRDEAVQLHANYLRHSWFDDVETGRLALYYGIGGRLVFADDPTAGIRFPIGLNYMIPRIPFDIFAEAVPILDIAPDVEFAGNGAVGIRLYF